MKLVPFALALLTAPAFAGATSVADQMTCAQAQAFGSSHRYLDYNRSIYGGSGTGRIYFFPISQCEGSQYIIRLNTRDSRSCAVGCDPNPGSEN